jgi:transketolase
VSERFDCRDAFAATLEMQADRDPRVVAVANDSVGSSKLGNFRKRFPKRFVNVGIAEQSMVGVGAGLANGGKLPFLCGASCFLTGRALEQIKADLGYSNHNVRLCGMSSGVGYGELGPTHHSIEDMAWTRVIPNLTVVVPADPIETKAVVEYSIQHLGPMFIRLSRMPVPNVHSENYSFELGKAARLREGRDITLIANGVMVVRALEAAEQLAVEGISARVLNMSSIKPLDRDAVEDAARSTRAIVTVEEHSVYGGLGGAVAEVVAQTRPVKMRILGIPGVFAPTGSAEWILAHFRLDAEGIRTAAVQLLESVAGGK